MTLTEALTLLHEEYGPVGFAVGASSTQPGEWTIAIHAGGQGPDEAKPSVVAQGLHCDLHQALHDAFGQLGIDVDATLIDLAQLGGVGADAPTPDRR